MCQFNHEYYDWSIKLIDLLLLGKMENMGLQKQITLTNVFYEESLDSTNNVFKLSDSMSSFSTDNSKKQQSEGNHFRKQLERKKYIDTKCQGNNTEHLYLIDAQWLTTWINYVRYSSASPPHMIINDSIYMCLEEQRELTLGVEVFLISQKLWSVFFAWYGGGPTLKWKIPIEEEKINLPQIERLTLKLEQPLVQKQKKGIYDAADLIVRNTHTILHRPSEVTPGYDPPSPKISVRGSMLNVSKSTYTRPKLFGLENNRYFCYLNAVLQCLFTLKDLCIYYEDAVFTEVSLKTPIQKGLKYSRLISELAEEINLKSHSISKPSQVRVLRTTKLRKLIQTQFNPTMEHDSHEFLLYFLNNLKDEVTDKESKLPQIDHNSESIWKTFRSRYPSEIDRLFTVIEKTLVQCRTCQKEFISTQYYLTFPLQVEGIKSLDQALSHYQKTEKLQDYKCESCKHLGSCHLSRSLLRLPEVFIFQMQRFTSFPSLRKLRGHVSFPEYLDMAPYYNHNSTHLTSLYELIAVAVHLGTINAGHYVAYCKKDGEWYFMDDERVGKVSREEVMQQDAYIMFYKKV